MDGGVGLNHMYRLSMLIYKFNHLQTAAAVINNINKQTSKKKLIKSYLWKPN